MSLSNRVFPDIPVLTNAIVSILAKRSCADT
jgi:hypothetical protein